MGAKSLGKNAYVVRFQLGGRLLCGNLSHFSSVDDELIAANL
jgi:hypothetical protein